MPSDSDKRDGSELFAGIRSHAFPLFVSANVLPLNMLYFESVCSLMHDISTNSAPQNICDACSYLFI